MYPIHLKEERTTRTACYAVSAAAHLSVLALAAVVPPAVSSLDASESEALARFAAVAVREIPEQPERSRPDVQSSIVDITESRSPGSRERDVASDEPDETGGSSSTETADPNSTSPRGPDASVDRAGVLGAASNSDDSASPADSIGSDAIHALGNLRDDEAPSSGSFGGLDLSGAGRGGGGGMSERGIGIGDARPVRGEVDTFCADCPGCTRTLAADGDSDEHESDEDDEGDEACGGGGGMSEDGIGFGDVPDWPEGRVDIRPTGADGSGANSDVSAMARQHRPGLRHCYERSLRRSPDLEGRVVFQLSIGPTGEVIAAEARDSTLDDTDLRVCLVREMQTWSADSPSTGEFPRGRFELVLRPE